MSVEMLLGDIGSIGAITAVTAGIAWRTLGKYWDKYRDGEATSFDQKFFATAIGAFIAALMVALPLMPQATELFAQNLGMYGFIFAWVLTAGWGYAVNEGVNYSLGRVQTGAEKNALKNIDEIVEQKVAEKLNNDNHNNDGEGGSSTEKTTNNP